MRGSPLFHLLLGALAFALFAIPVARLTFARPSPPAPVGRSLVTPQSELTKRVFIRVRVAHAPNSLSLKTGARELLAPGTDHAGSIIESEAAIEIPDDGLELALMARWPEGTPDTAVTVELAPDGLDARSETRWSKGARMSEILDFKW